MICALLIRSQAEARQGCYPLHRFTGQFHENFLTYGCRQCHRLGPGVVGVAEEIICSYWGFGLKVKPMDGGRLESGASKGLVFWPFEADALMQGFHAVAGIDEVGRGPLAGPVVAAAVILPRGFTHPEIKDSKMLSSKQREKLALIIQQAAQSWALGVIDVDGIDRLNILCASLTAMALALQCLTPKPDYVLIDGNQKIPLEFFAEVGSNSVSAAISANHRQG